MAIAYRNKYEDRLVTKGCLQLHGLYFHENFSPVIKLVTIRLFLTITLANKWSINQMDINNVFFSGFLDEEIFFEQTTRL